MLRSRLRILDRNPNSNPNPNSLKKMDPIKLNYQKPNLFSRNPKSQSTRYSVIIFSSVFISIVLFCYIFSFSNVHFGNSVKKYSVVIDGGSTGTRIHVFEYDLSKNDENLGNFGERSEKVDNFGEKSEKFGDNLKNKLKRFDFGPKGLGSMRVKPGLSAYVENTDGAGKSLNELLEFAKGRVPKRFWAETEVRLMATAGMRMVDTEAQGRILESCRKVLRASDFVFKDDWASIITGSDEGMYAWVVANYALGTLGGDPLSTTGIIELGGASAQVTFVSNEAIPTESSRIVRYGNITYNLYSHSLLQFGQNAAFDLLHESLAAKSSQSATGRAQKQSLLDPCTPSGYAHQTNSRTISPGSVAGSKHLDSLHPRGNFSECRSAALALLQRGKDKCSYEHCYIGSTYIPKLQGKFLATENFFHTGKFFGLEQRGFISGLMRSGQQFCEDDWPKLRKKYPLLDEDDLRRYCFSSAYIVAMLHDSLGMAVDDERVGFANQVEDVPLDWALGAFILQSTTQSNTDDPNLISASGASDGSTLFVLFVVAFILMFSAWSLSKWKKPHMKTIYDLEKGKYIVSRYQ